MSNKLPVPTLPPYPEGGQPPANKVPAPRRAPAVRANSTASQRRGGALLQLAMKAAGKSPPLKNNQPRSSKAVKVPVAPVGSLHSSSLPQKRESGQTRVFAPKLLGSISVGKFTTKQATTHKAVP